jgi:hypothetical protein
VDSDRQGRSPHCRQGRAARNRAARPARPRASEPRQHRAPRLLSHQEWHGRGEWCGGRGTRAKSDQPTCVNQSTVSEVRLAAAEPPRESISVREFLITVAASAELLAGQHKTHLSVEPSDPTMMIEGDSQLLMSAVMKLVGKRLQVHARRGERRAPITRSGKPGDHRSRG